MMPLNAAADPLSTVVLDIRSNENYAFRMCDAAHEWEGYATNAASLEKGCTSDRTCFFYKTVLDGCSSDGLGKFQKELTAQFLIQLGCNGVRFAQDTGNEASENSELIKRPHWKLSVELVPGYQKQVWNLRLSDPDTLISLAPPRGQGTPEEIARDVCSIASQRGAQVLGAK
jgi:hypothetical protein